MDVHDGWTVVERRPDGSHRVVSWGTSRHAVAGELRMRPGLSLGRVAARRTLRCAPTLGAAVRQAVDVKAMQSIEVTVTEEGVAELAAPPVAAPPPASAAALRAPVPRPRQAVVGCCAAGAGAQRHGPPAAPARGAGGRFRDGAGGVSAGGVGDAGCSEGGGR